MGLFLLYARTPGDRNANQFNSVLVEATDEAAARTAATANRPSGEVKVRDSWAALSLGAGEFALQTPPLSADCLLVPGSRPRLSAGHGNRRQLAAGRHRSLGRPCYPR